MKSKYNLFKIQAITLRQRGKTYGEIQKLIGQPIPKSTLSCWFQGLVISETHLNRLQLIAADNIKKARLKALFTNKAKRKEYIQGITERVSHLPARLKDGDVAKIALAMLYLGEGGKRSRGALMLGNSDPQIINLFLKLLRKCYDLDEKKFRCTVQCRADQNTKKLERFWSKITKIPLKQFYKARVDSRTIGKPSRYLDYKGVCRIDYFSAEILIELKQIISLIFKGP